MRNATDDERATTPLSNWDIPFRDLPQAGMTIDNTANPTQRAEIEKALDLRACANLALSLTLKTSPTGGIQCTGRLKAALEQNCIVSLEPVPAEIDEKIDALFIQDTSAADGSASSDDDMSILEELSQEPFDGTTLEVGRLAFEVLASALDPYPKAPGAHLGEATALTPGDADQGATSPFAKLQELDIPVPPEKPGKS